MDNSTNTRNNLHHEHRRQLKKKYRYNDSLSKYKKTMENLAKKQKKDPSQNKYEENLKKIQSGLTDISFNINREKIDLDYYKSNKSKKHDWTNSKRISLSAPKYHFLKASTPKRDYNLRRKKLYANTPKTLNDSSNYKTSNNYGQYIQTERPIKHTNLISQKVRNYSRPNFRSILSSNEFNLNTRKSSYLDDFNNYKQINTIEIGDSYKNKELLTLNNILQKQNKELRQNNREMRYKINDLLNNIKIIRIENQRLNSEKKKLQLNIANLENALDINKNASYNELESKSNSITQLKEEIYKLNVALEQKENEIFNLKNGLISNNNNYFNKNNTMRNNKYNLLKFSFNNTNNENDNDIQDLKYNFNNDEIRNEELNNININDLLNQINILKMENKTLKLEKGKSDQKNKMMNNELVNNNNKIMENTEKMN